MAERPNSPQRPQTPDKVRQLQRRVWTAAKRSPDRRFHALYDRISRRDVLEEAWKRVKRNKGAAGVDGQTLAAIKQGGVDSFLEEIHLALHDGTYRPAAVKRQYIPKADVRYCDDFVLLCRTRGNRVEAERVVRRVFEYLKLSLHPEKTRRLDLGWKRFLVKRKGRHLRAGDAQAWTRSFFVEHHGLYRLQGTTRYPEAA